MLVNTKRVQIPEGYEFPPNVESRTRDFKLSWFFITELGVAAIPPSGKHPGSRIAPCMFTCPTKLSLGPLDFYSSENAHLAEDYLRFAVCKDDEVLELAKERLRGLRKYLHE